MYLKKMSVSELLMLPIMEKCKLLAGANGIEKRMVRRINIVDTPDIAHWMLGEEFLMTTAFVVRENPLEIKSLIVELNNRNVSALGIKLGRFIKDLPEEVLKTADDLEFPLISLPMDCSFSQVTNEVLGVLTKSAHDDDSRILRELGYQDYIAGSFLEIMLQGKDINEILIHLRTLLNREIVFFDEKRRAFHAADANSSFYENVISGSPQEIRTEYDVLDLSLAEGNYGTLVINSPRQAVLPASWQSILKFAKAAIILHLKKERAFKQSELKYKDSFLKDLIFHHIHPDDDAIDEKVRAFFGASFRPPYFIMMADQDCAGTRHDGMKSRTANGEFAAREDLYSGIYRYLKAHYGRIHYTIIGGKMIGLISAHPDSRNSILKLEKLLTQFKNNCLNNYNCTVSISLSGEFYELLQADYAYKQVRKCLDFTRSTDMRDAFFIWSRLGIMRLLITASNNKSCQEEIKNFINQYLGGILQLPQAQAQRMIETLEVFSDNGWNMKLAAESMHIHYNTIRYRMKAISELVPFDLNNQQIRVDIHIAIKLYHINKDLSSF